MLANDSAFNGLPLTAVLVTGPTHGTLSANTDGTFIYAPMLNYFGADSFTYHANDSLLDSNLATVALTITPVNDAPVGTATTVTTLEDTAYRFRVADFGFSDPNDTPANNLLAVKITNLPTAGTFIDNGSTVIAGQFISVGDLNTSKLVFTPAPNANGLSYATFTFQVQDDGGAANGGSDLDPTPKTLTVTPVNDAPLGTDKTVTTREDTAYTFTAADFGFRDPADSPAHALTAVKITTLATDGALTLGGLPVTATQVIPVASLNAGDVKFFPDLNENGSPYVTFTFQVQDDGGTASGATLGHMIFLDSDAASYGWFIDPTPTDDAEFRMRAGQDALHAGPQSPAEHRMDLLTVVMHELGHVLGLEHTTQPHALMSETLRIGERRLVTEARPTPSAAQARPAIDWTVAAKALEMGRTVRESDRLDRERTIPRGVPRIDWHDRSLTGQATDTGMQQSPPPLGLSKLPAFFVAPWTRENDAQLWLNLPHTSNHAHRGWLESLGELLSRWTSRNRA